MTQSISKTPKPERVVIVVRGGCVQDVFAKRQANIDVEVIDLDNQEDTPEARADLRKVNRLEKSKTFTSVW